LTKPTKGRVIVLPPPSLLRQFRSFYIQNYPHSLEDAVDYFAVFGGLGWEIDTDRPLIELIEEVILENYGHLHNQIIDLTLGDSLYHALLSGIALGDRRTHSAFKRARVSEETGKRAIRYLCSSGIIELEPSRELPPQKEYPNQKLKKEIEKHRISDKLKHRISDKLHFTMPFLRFWFSFVSPLNKGIQQGKYDEVRARFANREQNFASLVFEKLSIELLKKSFEEDPVEEVGSYWDRQVEIDILARTRSGKVIVGECKYTNTKVNKSELSKLRDKCAMAGFQPDIIALFSKRGFSNELESLQGRELHLYSVNDLKTLLEDISPNEIIKGFPQPL